MLDQQTNIDRGKEKQTVSQAESNRKIQQLEKESKEMIEKLEYQMDKKFLNILIHFLQSRLL